MNKNKKLKDYLFSQVENRLYVKLGENVSIIIDIPSDLCQVISLVNCMIKSGYFFPMISYTELQDILENQKKSIFVKSENKQLENTNDPEVKRSSTVVTKKTIFDIVLIQLRKDSLINVKSVLNQNHEYMINNNEVRINLNYDQ